MNKVMRMGKDRLLKQVMLEVTEIGTEIQWRQNLEKAYVCMYG